MQRFAFMAVLAASLLLFALPGRAQGSRCIAFVENTPGIRYVNLTNAQVKAPEVDIEYVTHSTFRVTSPEGVVVATDYSGYAGEGPTPHIATMNQAHETHYTDWPDPAIKHVLKGWNPAGGPAKHHLKVADLLVRNVATDIRGWEGFAIPYGNSIFIYETADLCIGHLGHLHHKPTRDQFAQIGRLDIVFAPVDGGLTLDLPTMIEVLKELRASLVIPMHFFGRDSLEVFLAGMAGAFKIEVKDEPRIRVSLPGLPRRPTVMVLPGF